MVQRLVDMGQLSVEDAANSPQRSILYLSLGQKGRIEADVDIVSLADVNYMLLCSDGLWDMLEDHEIEQILRAAVGPSEASLALVEAANQAGGVDNITVVVAKF
jgi:PPM family protein phosphatase